VYGITPKLPAVAGNEGVGVVTSVGASVSAPIVHTQIKICDSMHVHMFLFIQVKDLRVGDWVIPADPAAGFGVCLKPRILRVQTTLFRHVEDRGESRSEQAVQGAQRHPCCVCCDYSGEPLHRVPPPARLR
jgi:hypothetical protein